MPHSLTPRDAHLFRTTAAALPARPQMFRLLKVMSIYWLSHHIVIPALTRVPLRSLHICYNTPTLLRLLSPVPVTSFPTTARPLPAPFKSRLRPPPASDSRLHFHDPCMCQSVIKYSYCNSGRPNMPLTHYKINARRKGQPFMRRQTDI